MKNKLYSVVSDTKIKQFYPKKKSTHKKYTDTRILVIGNFYSFLIFFFICLYKSKETIGTIRKKEIYYCLIVEQTLQQN